MRPFRSINIPSLSKSFASIFSDLAVVEREIDGHREGGWQRVKIMVMKQLKQTNWSQWINLLNENRLRWKLNSRGTWPVIEKVNFCIFFILAIPQGFKHKISRTSSWPNTNVHKSEISINPPPLYSNLPVVQRRQGHPSCRVSPVCPSVLVVLKYSNKQRELWLIIVSSVIVSSWTSRIHRPPIPVCGLFFSR